MIDYDNIRQRLRQMELSYLHDCARLAWRSGCLPSASYEEWEHRLLAWHATQSPLNFREMLTYKPEVFARDMAIISGNLAAQQNGLEEVPIRPRGELKFKGKTIFAVLAYKWYDEIASGRKLHEYREPSDYWNKRFRGWTAGCFDPADTTICFARGYNAFDLAFTIKNLCCHICKNDLDITDIPVWDVALGVRVPLELIEKNREYKEKSHDTIS